MNYQALHTLAHQCLLDLATDEGINASGKDEIYGCIFGRDSALTVLKILRAHSRKPDLELLEITRTALLTLTTLQGKEFNPESGEQVGKFIHEFRRDKYEHLLALETPWFVYPDGIMRNYDSIDSTPLTLIALHKYWQITQDQEFLIRVLPSVEAGLNWIITYGDVDKDALIEYDFPTTRQHGGLLVQSWTDSHESMRQANGQMPKYPIAPVEGQGYAWLALRLWSDYYSHTHPVFAKKLRSFADKMKKAFNQKFLLKDGFPAQALDGDKNQIGTVTGNPLLLLWASYLHNGTHESILDDKYVPKLVQRAFLSDLFDHQAGIRTMSIDSPTFNPNQDSYHNGSFWPILNGMAHEGLENWQFTAQANLLKEASLQPLEYFNTPIELYTKGSNGMYQEYRNASGQVSCRSQAWSAAALLDFVTA